MSNNFRDSTCCLGSGSLCCFRQCYLASGVALFGHQMLDCGHRFPGANYLEKRTFGCELVFSIVDRNAGKMFGCMFLHRRPQSAICSVSVPYNSMPCGAPSLLWPPHVLSFSPFFSSSFLWVRSCGQGWFLGPCSLLSSQILHKKRCRNFFCIQFCLNCGFNTSALWEHLLDAGSQSNTPETQKKNKIG